MAMQQSHYEINVSLEGKHFFATDARSATDEIKARQLLTLLRAKFPEYDGYKVTCTRIECAGKQVNF